MRSGPLIALVVALACTVLLWLALGPPAQRGGVAAAPVAAGPPLAEPGRPPEARRELDPGQTARTLASPERPAPAEPAVHEPSAPREPTGTELALLHVEVPFGTLEVQVLEGSRPLPGARVTAHGLLEGGPPDELADLLPHGLEAVTDAEGLVRFRGVGPDCYTVRTLAPAKAVLETGVVHATNRHRRVLMVYGTGTVRGHVHDREGGPLAGCLVTVGGQHELVDGQWTQALGTTDLDGAYRIDGLLSSEALWVTRTCGDDKQSVATRLAPGQERVIDFGVPAGAPRWTGTVRDSSGQPVRLPGDLTVLREEDQRRERFTYGPDGRFEVSLVPGSYTISTWGWAGSFVVDQVRVPPGELQHDLVLPGANLEVELLHADSSTAGPALDRVSVWLRETPDEQGHRAELGSGARRGFRCVPPGDYWLSTSPLRLVGTDPLKITVSATATNVYVRLAVGE